MEAHSPLEGLLAVDKPEGPTSHDAVARARRALAERRIGHTGTLDPFASGLLLLLLGRATRLAEFLVGWPKRYHGVARLGEAMDTDDGTGTRIAASDAWRDLREDAIRDAFAAQSGNILQTPPAFSAKKVAGRRAYVSARRGAAPSLAPVSVRIHSIRVIEIALPDVAFEIECSAGTYVRAVARDAGAALGTHGHLRSLRRLAVGPFRVETALALDAVTPDSALANLVHPLDALAHLERVDVDTSDARSLATGRTIAFAAGAPDGPIAVAEGGRLVAIGEVRDARLHPRKVFVDV